MMRKLFFFAVITSILIASCKSEKVSPITHISGTVPSGIDSVNIVINDIDLDTLILVKDGVFEADMKTCLTSMAYIGAGSYEAAFVLDGTPLKIELADSSIVTSLKPKISVQAAIEAYKAKSLDFQKAYFDSAQVIASSDTLDDLQKDELLVALSRDNLDKYTSYHKEIIEANKDNFLAAVAMVNVYESLSDQEIEQIFGMIDPKLREGEPLNAVWENLRSRKATSDGKALKDFNADVCAFDSNGKPFQTYASLTDILDGSHYYIVSFWNSQSPACIQQLQYLRAIAENYGPQGLGVLSVAVLDEPQAALDSAMRYGAVWPQLLNTEPSIVDEYGFRDFPTTLLVSPDGVIVKREDGLGISLFESIPTYL